MTVVISDFWLGVILTHLFWLTIVFGIAIFNTWRGVDKDDSKPGKGQDDGKKGNGKRPGEN